MQALAFEQMANAHETRSAGVSPPSTPPTIEAIRRVLNTCLALVGLALTAPVMILAALAVRVSSPGPVIFRQRRVGYCARRVSDRRGNISQEDGGSRKGRDRRGSDTGGQVFEIYKFRTMTVAEQPTEEWAKPNDPRITGVGRFLRRTRIDELPQLFNVLKGDMNIVGPRPEQPGIFAELRDQVDHYAARQRVKPGITGLAQVNLKYDQSIDDVRRKVQMDLRYIQSRGLKKDLEIMSKTVPVMLFKKGSM